MKKSIVFAITCLALLLFALGGTAFPAAAAGSFSDVAGHWAEQYIYSGVQKGYINGYTDGTFQPEKTVTRAEFSKMINSALGISGLAENSFLDVEEGVWYFNDIRKAIYAGYISGYNEFTFAPENNITRQEAAVILSRVVTKPPAIKQIRDFKDWTQIADWAVSAAEIVYSKSYMTGNDTGNFDPLGYLTRGQAAKIIAEMLNTEAVVSEDKRVADSINFSGRLFVNRVEIAGSAKAVTFSNCRLLGALAVLGGDEGSVTITDSAVNHFSSEKTTGDYTVLAKGGTVIQSAHIQAGVTIEQDVTSDGFQHILLSGSALAQDIVTLKGGFAMVALDASAVIRSLGGTIDRLDIIGQSTLFLQSGTVRELTVDSAAKGSSIALAQGTIIEKANIKAAAVFTGTGTIKTAAQSVPDVSYETNPDELTGTVSGSAGTLQPVFSPANASSDIRNSSSIVLTFDEKIYMAGGGNITSSYLADSAVELRKGSITGARVSFSASVSSSGRIVTITPSENLEDNTRYYILLKKDSLQNADSKTNPLYSSYFTTARISAVIASISPGDGAADVALNAAITVTFNEAVYRDTAQSALTPAHVFTSVAELRKGSASGAKVDFTATVSSSRKVVTIKPDTPLDKNTNYYVIVNGASVYSANGSTVSRTTSYFTTTGAMIPSVLPEDNAVNVGSDTDISLVFDEAVYRSSGSTLTADYLQTAIELRKNSLSGAKVSFTAFITSDRKTIVVAPVTELEKSMKYYVVLLAGTLSDAKGNQNKREYFSFTTAATLSPVITPANASIRVPTSSQISVAFSEVLYRASSPDVTINASYVAGNVVEIAETLTGALVEYNAQVSADKKRITITPVVDLKPDVRYTITILKDSLANASGSKNAKITSYFTTSEILIPDILPINQDDEVPTSTSVTVTFDETIYRDTGVSLTNYYIEDTAVEIRAGSEKGGFIAFTATLSSDRRSFTLKPTQELAGLTDYYIIINRGVFVNAAGEANPRIVSSFTTGQKTDTSISFAPAPDSSTAAVDAKITINFASPVYRYGGGTVTNAYLKSSALILRRTSAYGSSVPFTAVMSADRQTITITPDSVLTKNTKYFVQILQNTLQFPDGKGVPATSMSFTTNDGTPQINTYTATGVTATSAVINILSDSQGTAHVTVTSADGEYTKVYTLPVQKYTDAQLSVPGLVSETRYNVTTVIKNTDGLSSASKSLSFTTNAALKLSIIEYDDNSVKFNAEYGAEGTTSIRYTNLSTGVTSNSLTGLSVKAPGLREFSIGDLNQDTPYSVTVTLIDSSQNEYSKTIEFTTEQAADYLSLVKLEIIDKSDTYTVPDLNYSCFASIAKTASVKIRPTVADPSKVTITVNGKTVESGKESENIAVVSGAPNTVQVVIKAQNNASVTYKLTIDVA